MHIIETQNLTRRYGRTEAVHDLNLAVPEGSVCALLGPNGAGKTTTLKVLMNLLAPTAGAARVLGVDSRRLGEREFRQIGYVSENQPLPRWMTVRQLLDYCRPFYPTWDQALEQTLLRAFDLPEDRKLAYLSRGMAMKAALLSSLAYRPRLLVLDEPFSGLDPLVRDDFIRGVLEVSGQGDWTVLVASHDIEEVERLAEHVAVLEAGRLTLTERTDDLQARHRRVEVTLGESEPAATERPDSWLQFERAGRVVRFVDTRYERDRTEAECRRLFPGAAVVAGPMSLREIFVVLARRSRANREQAA